MPTTKTVTYQLDGADRDGLLVLGEAAGSAPTVLVFHDWGGRSESQEGFAHRLAEMGYHAFGVDIYGKRGGTPEQNQALMGPLLEDRALLRRLLLETVEVVAALPEVDSGALAAIGFCFGGLCVLDLARAGGAVKGVASFHGLFTPPGLPTVTPIRAKIAAYHGWADPMVKPDTVVALGEELTAAGADWQLHGFGGALHAFMVEGANMPSMGVQYDETTAKRAWAYLELFLREVLGR